LNAILTCSISAPAFTQKAQSPHIAVHNATAPVFIAEKAVQAIPFICSTDEESHLMAFFASFMLFVAVSLADMTMSIFCAIFTGV